jgi:hypothetical protein
MNELGRKHECVSGKVTIIVEVLAVLTKRGTESKKMRI